MKKISRIEQEKQTVELMIHLYCRRKEGNKALCPSCAEVLEYARRRLSRCPYAERKKTCRRCPTHCYNPGMKKKIKEIMAYSGPRMCFRHPLAAIRHLWQETVVDIFPIF